MVHINATESPFQRDDVHFLEATYFDELAKGDEVVPFKPRGAPLPEWENLEGGEPRVDNSAFASRVDRGRENKAIETTRGPVRKATVQGKCSSQMEERHTFYDVLRGQILLWSLNPITMKILYVLQMNRLMNRQ